MKTYKKTYGTNVILAFLMIELGCLIASIIAFFFHNDYKIILVTIHG